MTLGTTSYGFRYLLLNALRAPPLAEVVQRAKACGVESLQICENARPLALREAGWRDLVRCGAEAGVRIELGCATLELSTLQRYLERVAMIPSRVLRVVLEEQGRGNASSDDIRRFLDSALPQLEASGIQLAIENHFHVPSRTLADVAGGYPAQFVGFCVDSANSLRNFESPGQVLDLLGARAVCYHVKDFRVTGTNVGFRVDGAPLGRGDLGVTGFLHRVLERDPSPALFVENWVPQTGDRAADVEADRRWLCESLAHLRSLLRSART